MTTDEEKYRILFAEFVPPFAPLFPTGGSPTNMPAASTLRWDDNTPLRWDDDTSTFLNWS